MKTSKWRGHDIILIDDIWHYIDAYGLRIDTERDCGFCQKSNTPEGHDGCLGTLPNIMNACCGHGIEEDAYLQYLDGTIIRGKISITKMKELNG